MNDLNHALKIESVRQEEQIAIVDRIKRKGLNDLQRTVHVHLEIASRIKRTERSILYEWPDEGREDELNPVRVWRVGLSVHYSSPSDS